MRDHVDDAILSGDVRRQRMVNAAWAVYERRQAVAYSQARPSQLLAPAPVPVRLAAKRISRADCSGLVSLACKRAGIRPGVDWRYQNTWTLLKLFPHEVPLERYQRGDLVFYGPASNDPHHVAILLDMGQTAFRVLTNGHHPMSVEDIDYRPDRIHIRSLLP